MSFDGCRESDGTMLEAKGPGFAQHMDGQGGWDFYFTLKGLPDLQWQMQRQSNAARGRNVEWHFAEKSVADYFRRYAEHQGLGNIIVIYDPPKQP